ncbi:hypothetical protein GLAREA_12222 [Glarea lozoyensis ATCC 20868]|uniref:Uncharacterized protein n=1 Tax=Glarea lozoyensis (strain ATCC 20868 / MF5171) TaxID=1116229 RepID=S3D2T7_GLAL2|nr:uncharacterized protein GLAREA_12222 [Glarea lozoyensis ATCC 20868]EPE32140.1 hypothetical protein GLAREA_12222 [Glarea lozoyensis ATCC 20868]
MTYNTSTITSAQNPPAAPASQHDIIAQFSDAPSTTSESTSYIVIRNIIPVSSLIDVLSQGVRDPARIFTRKDHLTQHVRKVHQTTIPSMTTNSA